MNIEEARKLLGTIMHIQVGEDSCDDIMFTHYKDQGELKQHADYLRGKILDGPLAGMSIEIPLPK